jgi:hypothetical protein
VLAAQKLPDDSPWKAWCLLAAPSLSVGLGAILVWVQAAVKQFWIDWRYRSEMRTTKAIVQAGLTNQRTSDAHKAVLVSKLENLERVEIDNQIERVEALANTQDRISNQRGKRRQ